MLSPLLDDEVALEIVTWHHERWDGDGYPNGLQGETIPLSARIVAMADVLDALTTARPHREAIAWDDAVRIIKEDEGHFDPRVLEAFVRALPTLKDLYENGTQPSSFNKQTKDS
jgi:putative two-component system response regulator